MTRSSSVLVQDGQEAGRLRWKVTLALLRCGSVRRAMAGTKKVAAAEAQASD